mmetsp:Transcript_25839/g.77767  ORF Transcript_25839/g.77767 Transcript_25839/m.77767 type:complete len:120 (-) Transcript_25839:41-400(-)
MLWSFIAYFVAPLGIAVWALLLSGLRPLQSISKAVIGLTMSIGGATLTIPMFIALFSAVAWSWETYALFGGRAPRSLTEADLARRWREERNWWILNFNLLLWLTNWRAGALLSARGKSA